MPNSTTIIDKFIEALRQGVADGAITPKILHYCESAPMVKVALPSVLVDWISEDWQNNQLDSATLQLTVTVDNSRADSIATGLADSGARDLRSLADSIRRFLNRASGPNSCLDVMKLQRISYRTGSSDIQGSVAQATMTYLLKYKESAR